jgi:hypothetical protein
MMTTQARHSFTLATLLLALVANGCGGDTEVVSVELETGNRCENLVQDFLFFQSISIAVWGEDETGAVCRLGGDRCINVDQAESIPELEDGLRAAERPLVDVPADGAIQLAVVAYASVNCDPEVEIQEQVVPAATACGFEDVAGASSGALPVQMDCDIVGLRRCGAEVEIDPPPCP